MDPSRPKSSSSTKKWLIGCGIGCGAILLILIFLIAGGVFFIKNIVNEFEDSDAIMDTLTERYGKVKEYCPDPDGTIKPDRLEAFLEAREAMAPIREELERSINILSNERKKREVEEEKSRSVFKKIKTGIGLIPQIADFYKSRSQALLDVGMGIGEYYFIYTVAYFSWLGKPVVDGSEFQFVRDRGDRRSRYWDDEESEEIQRDMMIRGLHRMILPMLRNQYEKLTEGDFPQVREKWRKALEEEIKAMESNRYRLVWEDGVPPVIEDSLRPFRKRLEASYSPMLNALEVSFEQR